MLYFLALALLAVWVIALALKVTAGVIHIALVLAIVFFVIGLIRGARTPRTPAPP